MKAKRRPTPCFRLRIDGILCLSPRVDLDVYGRLEVLPESGTAAFVYVAAAAG